MHQFNKRGEELPDFYRRRSRKTRSHVCAIIKEADELGCFPRVTRKRERNGERADRSRREARDSDLITLQNIDDEIRDRRKGSENKVKSRREEPNGTKAPRAVKEEEVEVESEDGARRQCSLSSTSDSQDGVGRVEKRKAKRAIRSRTRDRNEKREELQEVDQFDEINNLEMQLINHRVGVF